MNTDALYATQHPDTLPEIALALLNTEGKKILQLTRRIAELEEALKLARQARFGRKSEAFTGEQRQLAEEDVAADRADLTRQLRELLNLPGNPGDYTLSKRSFGHVI